LPDFGVSLKSAKFVHREGNAMDSKVRVTGQEMETAFGLSAKGDFSAALALFREMLDRADERQTRMKLLFGMITCSTYLDLHTLTENTVKELNQLGDPQITSTFVKLAQSNMFIDCGRAQEALDLIDSNLNLSLLETEFFQDWKYEHLFLRGRCLTALMRSEEALLAFDAARDLDSEGKYETDMLIERSNCLLALSRFDEAFNSANQVLSRNNGEMATLAMQYMAECRMWQSRVPEALKLYVSLQKRLLCRLISEERIQTGIRNAMTYLEKQQEHRLKAQRKPH
jgi:tetratricopeptide (TPR) repeat protein